MRGLEGQRCSARQKCGGCLHLYLALGEEGTNTRFLI